jgi:hypothetical protein
MTITFENESNVIVYALEKIVLHARKTQQIFVAHCVWWLASIIGLEKGLVNYLEHLQTRLNVTDTPGKASGAHSAVSSTPRDNQEDQRKDQVLKECEEFLRNSKRQREIANLRATGTSQTGRVNPFKATKDSLRVSTKTLNRKERNQRKQGAPVEDCPKTARIEEEEIQRRKSEGECLRCAWPADRKGAHRVRNCTRPIKLDKGTANYLKAKEHQKVKQFWPQSTAEEVDTEQRDSDGSSDESL